ncbi:hypothetical protein ACQ4PT_067658 [Festuca glaucescens]
MASTSVVTLNVGGELFQTTAATLSAPAHPPHSPHSPLRPQTRHTSSIATPASSPSSCPSSAAAGLASPPPSPALLAEARHFALDDTLLASLSPASAFSPLSLRPAALLPLTGRVAPSTVAISPSPRTASLLAAHGGVVTSFDAALAYRASVLTPLPPSTRSSRCPPLSPSLAPATFLASTSAGSWATPRPQLRRRFLGRTRLLPPCSPWPPRQPQKRRHSGSSPASSQRGGIRAPLWRSI